MAAAADFAHHVPHYDVFGTLHHRHPYKDKSHLLTEDIRHHKWLQPPPAIRSRSELQQARKRGRVPDPSYDFDGDGVVGQLDYFVGRSFDKNRHGRLDPSERRQAEEALQNGFLDKFVRGLDSQGDKMRPFAVQQKRGVVLSADNGADVSLLTYPPHHNAHKTPKHSTQTALNLARLGERKGKGAEIGERYIAANLPVPDLQPPNAETHPRTCEISHICQRAEADHQLSRVRGGLLPMNSYVNPERESRTCGLGWEDDPPMKTRSQLIETRKEGMRRQCEELGNRNAETQIPLSVRRAEKEAREYDFRQANPDAMTLTKLKDMRRRDKIEYDMERFAHKAREYPRFSDRADIPFWVSSAEEDSRGNHGDQAPPVAISRSISEPHFKVNEVPFGDNFRDTHQSLPDAAYRTAAGLRSENPKQKGQKSPMGSNTKKRFCAELIERGQARNQPRLFDAIQPLHTGPLDIEELDIKSSMAPVREAAYKKRLEQRRKNADNPRRSMLWSDANVTSDRASAALHGDMTGMTSMSEGMGNMSVERRSQVSAAQVQPRTAIHKHVSSTPTLHSAGPATLGAPKEPRFFGSVTTLKPDLTQKIGVRCGGFQRLDWPSQHSMTQPPHHKSDHHKRSTEAGHRGGNSREGHATQTSTKASAQPL